MTNYKTATKHLFVKTEEIENTIFFFRKYSQSNNCDVRNAYNFEIQELSKEYFDLTGDFFPINLKGGES